MDQPTRGDGGVQYTSQAIAVRASSCRNQEMERDRVFPSLFPVRGCFYPPREGAKTSRWWAVTGLDVDFALGEVPSRLPVRRERPGCAGPDPPSARWFPPPLPEELWEENNNVCSFQASANS